MGKVRKKLQHYTVKILNVVIEELKQRIIPILQKVRRCQGRVNSYRQNRLFGNNQRQFYSELDQEEERYDDDQPVAEESKQILGNIWSQSADHKKDASGYKTCEVKFMLKNRKR